LLLLHSQRNSNKRKSKIRNPRLLKPERTEDLDQLIHNLKVLNLPKPKKEAEEEKEEAVVVSEVPEELVVESSEVEVKAEAAEAKAEAEVKAEAKEETIKVKVVTKLKAQVKVNTDLEVAEVAIVVVAVETVLAEAVDSINTDPKLKEKKVEPSKVTRVKLLLIERKKLIIEERAITPIKVNPENNGTLMIEKMAPEEEEVTLREATERATGVTKETKSMDKLNQLKVKKVKSQSQRLKK
jgi:hypothetical protein